MWLLLLHTLLIVHLLAANKGLFSDAPKSTQKDTNYIIKHIATCPDIGYYFHRASNPNSLEPEVCYLCFCQGDQTAVCWRRDNRRCNRESFRYHGVARRHARVRRGLGFTDIFFRDAARDMLNKGNMDKQCQPFESSFSEDCPPADWCTGCTVCDCDANGHWDCHVLSFCPDRKQKDAKENKRKGVKYVGKKHTRKTVTAKPTRTTSHHSTHTKPKNTPKPTHKVIPRKPKPNTTSKTPKKKQKIKSTPKQIKKIIKKSGMLGPSQNKRSNISIQMKPKRKFASSNQPKLHKITNLATLSPPKNSTSFKRLEDINKQIGSEDVRFTIALDKNKKQTMDLKNYTNLLTDIIYKQIMSKVDSIMLKRFKQYHEESVKLLSKVQVPNARKYNKAPPPKTQQKPTGKPKPNQRQNTNQKVKRVSQKKLYKYPQPQNKDHLLDWVVNRFKREALLDIKLLNTSEDVTNTTQTVITPLDTTIANLEDLTNFTEFPVSTVSLNTSTDNFEANTRQSTNFTNKEYYKYDVSNKEPFITSPIENKTKQDKDIKSQGIFSETVINLILPNATLIVTVPDGTEVSTLDQEITTISNKFNGSTKWKQFKILASKYKGKKNKTNKFLNTTNPSRVSIKHGKVHSKDIERILSTKKYNLIKIIRENKINNTNNNDTVRQTITEKLNNLKNTLNMLFNNRKRRKMTIYRYLKTVFNKIFSPTSPHHSSQHHIITSLCHNFGPCWVGVKDKRRLKLKVQELDTETKKIMKSIKIIKGLLKLYDIPIRNDRVQYQNFTNDVHKLSDILKHTDLNESPLTETQKRHIEFIKENTQDFVNDVTRFATLLLEIISILTKQSYNNSKVTHPILKQRDKLRNDFTNDHTLQNIKQLIIKYNTVHNVFMKKMNKLLNNYQNKTNKFHTNGDEFKMPKLKADNSRNNSAAIENISRNIIKNLKKMKQLAKTLTNNRTRTKREIRDNDSLEYLLMLMEYLLKQSHPLDAVPVNDEIDLLIEAIKNAPDIKTIKKKVLEPPTPIEAVRFTTSATPSTISEKVTISKNVDSIGRDDLSVAENDKFINDDKSLNVPEEEEIKTHHNKEMSEATIDDVPVSNDEIETENNGDNNIKLVDKVNSKFENKMLKSHEESTEIVFTISDSDKENDIIPATTPINTIYNRYNTANEIDFENSELKQQNEGRNERKHDIFTADIEEDDDIPDPITVYLETSSTLPKTTEVKSNTKKKKLKLKNLTLESNKIKDDSDEQNERSKQEWIMENFGYTNPKHIVERSTSTTVVPVSHSETSPAPKSLSKVDISVWSSETSKYNMDKKTKAKINTEEVMLKKQMDLLNSLDYGTEKVEFDESVDSKNANGEDKVASYTDSAYL